MKWQSIRGFNKYDINLYGVIKNIRNNFLVNSYVNESDGNVYVKLINNRDKEQECLLADLVLSQYNAMYRTGFKINFKDENKLNCRLENLKFKPPRLVDNTSVIHTEPFKIGYWRCESKADSVNARAKNNEKIDKFDVYRILQLHSFKCIYCQDDLNSFTWQIDHYRPLSKGGDSLVTNLVPTCKICNMMKGNLFYEQFINKARQIISVNDSTAKGKKIYG